MILAMAFGGHGCNKHFQIHDEAYRKALALHMYLAAMICIYVTRIHLPDSMYTLISCVASELRHLSAVHEAKLTCIYYQPRVSTKKYIHQQAYSSHISCMNDVYNTVYVAVAFTQFDTVKTSSLPPLPTRVKVTSRCGRDFVNTSSLFPKCAPAFYDTDKLFGDSLSEHASTTSSALLLAGCVQNPHECLSASLAQTEWDWNLKRYTTTCRSSLGTDT